MPYPASVAAAGWLEPLRDALGAHPLESTGCLVLVLAGLPVYRLVTGLVEILAAALLGIMVAGAVPPAEGDAAFAYRMFITLAVTLLAWLLFRKLRKAALAALLFVGVLAWLSGYDPSEAAGKPVWPGLPLRLLKNARVTDVLGAAAAGAGAFLLERPVVAALTSGVGAWLFSDLVSDRRYFYPMMAAGLVVQSLLFLSPWRRVYSARKGAETGPEGRKEPPGAGDVTSSCRGSGPG